MKRECEQKTHDRSYSFHEILEHDKYPDEVHAYTTKVFLNAVDKDESPLTQAQKLEHEWPLWREAIKTELTSLIIKNEVFEPVKIDDVPIEKQNKIF